MFKGTKLRENCQNTGLHSQTVCFKIGTTGFYFPLAIVSNDTEQNHITKQNLEQFGMLLCNKVQLV